MGRSGYTCVRHVFCSLNVLMWLAGCAILAAGLYLRLAAETNVSLLPQYALLSADSAFIATGVTMFVLAFFGCCGAWFQSHCMLVTYFSLVIFLCLVEFMFGTLAFVFSSFLDRIISDELKDGIKHHYNTSSDNSLNMLWTHLQTELHCCGVKNYEDWYLIDAWPDKRWVPDSCCRPEVVNTTGCGKENSFLDSVSTSSNTTAWYDTGCVDQVKAWFISRLLVVGIVGIVVTFIQLFGLISSMLLFCTVRHKRHSQTYKSYDPAA